MGDGSGLCFNSMRLNTSADWMCLLKPSLEWCWRKAFNPMADAINANMGGHLQSKSLLIRVGLACAGNWQFFSVTIMYCHPSRKVLSARLKMYFMPKCKSILVISHLSPQTENPPNYSAPFTSLLNRHLPLLHFCFVGCLHLKLKEKQNAKKISIWLQEFNFRVLQECYCGHRCKKKLIQCVSINYDLDFITHIFYYGSPIVGKSRKEEWKAIGYSQGQIAVTVGEKKWNLEKSWKNGEDGKTWFTFARVLQDSRGCLYLK